MKIQRIIAATLMLSASVIAQQTPTQSTITGQIARCEEVGKIMGTVARSRDDGIPMSVVLESMQMLTGHAPDMKDRSDRSALQYIGIIYAEHATPEETERTFTNGCIQGVTQDKAWAEGSNSK